MKKNYMLALSLMFCAMQFIHGSSGDVQRVAHDPNMMLLNVIYSENQNINDIQIALDEGADINSTDNSGSTALMYAKSFEVAEYLISHGANLYMQNKEGLIALTVAAKNGYMNVALFLQEEMLKDLFQYGR